MGYTHYFTTSDNIQSEDIESIKKDFTSTLPEIKKRGVCLIIDDVPEISFNGIEGEDYEQFILNVRNGFDFCKTQYRPYDLAVMICLVIAKEYLKERIEIRSDGKSEDWQPAMDTCQEVLGYGDNFRLNG